MKIQILQDLIDVLRGKKEIKIVKKDFGLIIPKAQKQYARKVNDKPCTWIQCFGLENAQAILSRNKSKLNLLGLYSKGDSFITEENKNLHEIFVGQKRFLEEKLVPLIKETDTLCDVGCASGEFTFMFPKYCKSVEGIEYFQKYVDFANKQAQEQGIQNISFYQGDVNKNIFYKKYNHILLMGVLPHIFEENKVKNIIRKIYEALENEGYLTIKCNVTNDDRDFFNISSNHSVEYHSKNKLKKYIEEAGFELVVEDWAKQKVIELPQLNTKVDANHWMSIYKKNVK